MGDDFGVGLALEDPPLGDEFVAQRLEVLDDAVVDQGNLAGCMRMGVVLGRRTMRRPAGVGDADQAGERFGLHLAGEIVELALGAAAIEPIIVDGADAGRIIAEIFEPAKTFDETARHVLPAHYADNATHRRTPHLPAIPARRWSKHY